MEYKLNPEDLLFYPQGFYFLSFSGVERFFTETNMHQLTAEQRYLNIHFQKKAPGPIQVGLSFFHEKACCSKVNSHISNVCVTNKLWQFSCQFFFN